MLTNCLDALLNCWLASMPLQFNNNWRQFYICLYKTAVHPLVLILHPECTISLIFRYFDVGWCLSRCKSGQSTRFWKFCESRRLRLRKNWCFGSKCSVRALFKISIQFNSIQSIQFIFHQYKKHQNNTTHRWRRYNLKQNCLTNVAPLYI